MSVPSPPPSQPPALPPGSSLPTVPVTSLPVLMQLESHILPTLNRIEQIATRAFALQEQSALVAYPISQARSDAVELLSLLSSLPPLLQSTYLSHVTPAMSTSCSTAEQLNNALRDAAAAKESVLLRSLPRAQQLAVDRLAQHNKQRQLT